jgi:hypothetical protein
MTSVTVAGGSFDAPRRVRRAKGVSLSSRHQTWLRYGVGVSIAALLGANGIALTSMLGDAARELTGRADGAAATEAAAVTPAAEASGAGFAAFDVPVDLDAHYRALAARTAPAASATGVAPSSAAPFDMFSPPAAATPAQTPGAGPAKTTNGNTGTTNTGDTNVPQATDPSVVDQVVATIATVPEVGPAVAPVIAEAAAEVEEAVVDPVVTTVAEPAPAPVGDAVTETVGGLL